MPARSSATTFGRSRRRRRSSQPPRPPNDGDRDDVQASRQEEGRNPAGPAVARDRQHVQQHDVDDHRRRERRPQPRPAQPPAQTLGACVCSPSAGAASDMSSIVRPTRYRPGVGTGACTRRSRTRRVTPRRKIPHAARERGEDGDRDGGHRRAGDRPLRAAAARGPGGAAALTCCSCARIEERAMNLYRQGKVPGSFYDGFGQEAVSVGAAFAMSRRRTACASCTATSARTSSAASSPRGSSPSTWAAPAASRAGATATSTSATTRRAASAWSRCSPT